MAGRAWIGRVLIAALLAAGPATGLAQDLGAAQVPILTLDDDRLFTESRFGKSVLARQESEAQALLAENREIEARLEAEERDLTARRASMEREEFATLSEAFNVKVEGIRKAQDAKLRDLNRRVEDERQRFFEAVRPVLATIMQDRGALAIIDKRAILVGFENIDVTSAAITALDAALGDGSQSSPAPASP